MTGYKELIKKLSEDDALRQQIIDTPSREGKLEVVSKAGFEPPDHHDVLQAVAGGVDTGEAVGIGAGVVGGVSAAAAAATAAVI